MVKFRQFNMMGNLDETFLIIIVNIRLAAVTRQKLYLRISEIWPKYYLRENQYPKLCRIRSTRLLTRGESKQRGLKCKFYN